MKNQKRVMYKAPDGYVYDYAEPRYATIINENGETTTEQEHLYVKYLSLSASDNIDKYILVKDPKGEKDAE